LFKFRSFKKRIKKVRGTGRGWGHRPTRRKIIPLGWGGSQHSRVKSRRRRRRRSKSLTRRERRIWEPRVLPVMLQRATPHGVGTRLRTQDAASERGHSHVQKINFPLEDIFGARVIRSPVWPTTVYTDRGTVPLGAGLVVTVSIATAVYTTSMVFALSANMSKAKTRKT